MTTYESLSLIVMFFSALFVGVSVLFLSRQIKLFIKAHADNHEWNRRIATQNALTRVREINRKALVSAFDYANARDAIPIEKALDAIQQNPQVQLDLHNLLNSYEGLANGVFSNTYDNNIVRTAREGVMTEDFYKFRSYIYYRREHGGKMAWRAYERLVEKWHDQRVKISDREQTGWLQRSSPQTISQKSNIF